MLGGHVEGAMAKKDRVKKERKAIKLGKGKAVSPATQKFIDALVKARAENNTTQVRNLEKIIKRLEKGAA